MKSRRVRAAIGIVIGAILVLTAGAGAGAASASEARTGSAAGVQHYDSCTTNYFCGYDWLTGGNMVFQQNACGLYKLGGSPAIDKIASIDNKSTHTVLLLDWVGYWDVIWESLPGNWGDLPAAAHDKADGILILC
ncbi:hypothetical protein ACIQUM_19225 [Amycolatopsis azurea]|uniref:hypothetical protein n=1 Tax=Amycolatopsis azurea TaxID=36819 RepID=UPI00381CA9FC